ncbi:hypothetical protein A2U01_0108776 [Trifolium medium]|uniref:Uncharacterized protein n=1 Tax=Trifolium medium TaxID=97028 RepID=A0A392VJ90_9FABA|nr:hypothetical protein [Trifolium medium]
MGCALRGQQKPKPGLQQDRSLAPTSPARRAKDITEPESYNIQFKGNIQQKCFHIL